MLHYKLSAAERTVKRRAICLIISCCGFNRPGDNMLTCEVAEVKT